MSRVIEIQNIEDALLQGRKLKIIFDFVEIDDEIGVGVDIDAEDTETGEKITMYLGANSFYDALNILNEKVGQ